MCAQVVSASPAQLQAAHGAFGGVAQVAYGRDRKTGDGTKAWLLSVLGRAALLILLANGVVFLARELNTLLGPLPLSPEPASIPVLAVEALLLGLGTFAFLAGSSLWLFEDGFYDPGGPRGPWPGFLFGGGGGTPPPPWAKWLLIGIGLVLALVGVFRLAHRVDLFDLLMRHSFLACALASFAILQFTLRRRVLKLQSWKKLSDVWLKLGGVTGLSLGGIGVLVSTELLKAVAQVSARSPYVDRPFLAAAYFTIVGIFGLACFFTLTGRASAGNEDSSIPLKLFIPAFACAWLASAGFFTLFFNTLLLSMHALAIAPPGVIQG